MKRHPRTLAKTSSVRHQGAPEDDALQDIEDDGMDMTQLGQANDDDDSEAAEEDEEEESDEEYGGEDAMDWDGLGRKDMGRSGREKSDAAPPTTKDIKMVNEASDLFGSNAFKLKVCVLETTCQSASGLIL